MKCFVIISVFFALAYGNVRIPSERELAAFIRSVPRFPTKRLPTFPPLPLPTLHTDLNRPFRGTFRPLEGCSINKTLELWDFGTIQTPNYPEDYPSDTSCEWVLEGPEGSKIEATVFDLETQSWFLGYYDYVAFSLDGNFEKVDQFAGDANDKTPFVVTSTANKLGVRFKSNGFINYRGMKLSYTVRPERETADNGYQISNDDGQCGRSFVLEEPAEESTTVSEPEETTVVPDETTVTPEETTAAAEEPVTEASGDETRIIGHTPAPKHAYPWMTALLINGRSFCGGSLIDNQHILTAAHCTDGATEIIALIGGHNLRASKQEEPYRRVVNISASDIHQHPQYNEETVTHDISIIRLPEPITFNEAIKPICLPNRQFLNQFFEKRPVNVTGWGTTGDKQGISPELQVTNVTVMNNGHCRQVFRDILTGNQICSANSPTNSACRGDSGGPLFLRQSGAQGDYLMQVGIVSFGTVTCERGYPVAYSRVTAFLDFINEVTGKQL